MPVSLTWAMVDDKSLLDSFDYLRPSHAEVLRFGMTCVGEGREAQDPLEFPLQCFSRGKPRGRK
jgi:hypothetical protein